ncbi:hypothetical protein QJS66_14250 [Kocuria rhizophila]|nr:hypothetical protein QJS66_14250 [Kocuria rhizophila]
MIHSRPRRRRPRMSLEGARNRSGASAGLTPLGVGLYTVMMAYLIPSRATCRSGTSRSRSQPARHRVRRGDPGVHLSDVAGGFFTGGPTGLSPCWLDTITTIIGGSPPGLSSLTGWTWAGLLPGPLAALLALVWLAIVAVVSSPANPQQRMRWSWGVPSSLAPWASSPGPVGRALHDAGRPGYARGNPAVAGSWWVSARPWPSRWWCSW